MAPLPFAVVLPGLGEVSSFEDVGKKWHAWLDTQDVAVQVLVTGLQSSIQGGAIGYMFGSISAIDPTQNGTAPKPANPALDSMMKAGPWGTARNLAALTGVQAAATLAIKKARNGKEDVYSSMAASFLSGVAYSLVSGSPNPIQSAITTGAAFGLFNGLIYQVGQAFKPEFADTEYDRGKYMLKTLGLTKYVDNLKKGLLTDNTIMLWNDIALAEVRIPPGPRLLILHHLDTYRNPSSVLKPALPLPPLPPPPPPMAAAAAGASGR
ncbi:hypothetical protein CHLRE_03g183100v5 [Chlamydomonas reinhardtii]|uniref:Uncharacterized protein n=1 Tax=Chlamydomonas reinhardtii TaxID=3055 RepID=A8JH77_CHLRE|nr:uncharacterized protein CHLRE_03g183100v5 [Chlamydomonas reinhardtii]PNW85367.1 hypothetical protein CHLRE_03g183100v5 [Chlamydomonas reinhardtii]|eukprot:XP_001702924.1 mitochondrial inner membrane translocase [Chlamydomonas reinhardtii]